MTENKPASRTEALAEALLFAAGDGVSLTDAAIVLKLDKKEAAGVMERLAEQYESRNGGILLRRINDTYQLCSRPDLHEDLRDYFEKPKGQGLSRAAMETLSIIAYNQPITRSGIELVRGVNSDSVLLKLIDRGLVYECGRSENPGRPMLYGTTDTFLQSMGISDLSMLPPLELAEENAAEEGPAASTLFEYNDGSMAPEELAERTKELDSLIEEVD